MYTVQFKFSDVEALSPSHSVDADGWSYAFAGVGKIGNLDLTYVTQLYL